MSSQETKKYKILSGEEERKYDIKKMKFNHMSSYNESLSYFVDENNLLVMPNLPAAEHSILVSKADYELMEENKSFPVLQENDTPYFQYKHLINEKMFTKESMLLIFEELGFKYTAETFYKDAEKLSKSLTEEDKKKFLIPMLYFIGEDLRNQCSEAKWIFNTLYYFQPFNEAVLYYEKQNFSFYNLNLLLEEKLLTGKNITFSNIYKRVESNYLRKKVLWH
ncbi:hypothetical protein [Chryseobacterium jejuense]|nr:hypothetical protein [Chryseobacterium jejuense]